MVTVCQLDVVEVEQTDKEQQASIADGNNYERHSANIPHLTIELEVSFPTESLVSPLNDPGVRQFRQRWKKCSMC